MFFVYILRCSDNCYYVGSTQNVEQRIAVHQSGKGPSFTAARLPVALIHQESFATIEEAVRRERQIKGWSRAKKTALISGEMTKLKELSVSRQSPRHNPSPTTKH